MFEEWILRLFRKSSHLHGSAGWMGEREKRTFLSPRHDGLVIDGVNRITMKRSCANCAVYAPTEGGKTSGFIIPNLKALSQNASAVVTDPSREIFDKTAPQLRERGFRIKRLDFCDADNSEFFNPMHRADTGGKINELCGFLVANAETGGTGGFWNGRATTVLKILSQAVKRCADPAKRHFGYVLECLNILGIGDEFLKNAESGEVREIRRKKAEIERMLVENLDKGTWYKWLSMTSKPEETLQCILANAEAALAFFEDSDIVRLTSKDTLDFEGMRREPTVIYVTVPEHRVEHYQPVLNFVYSQMFAHINETPYGDGVLPVFFFLEEFANTGKIPNFDSVMTTIRKRGASISLILQDEEQVAAIYGEKSASAILNGGCKSKIYFPALGQELREKVERILGNKTFFYKESGYSKQLGEIPNRDREVGRSLMTADEIRRMDDDEIIYVYGNKRPVKLKVTPYYKK